MTTVAQQQNDARLLEGWSVLGNFLSGFRHLALINCAHKIGVFAELVKSEQTAKSIADATNASDKGIELMLNCFVSMGVMENENGNYRFKNGLAEFFDEQHENNLLNEITNVHVSLNAWMNLDKVMLKQDEGNSQDYGRMLFDGNCHQYKGLQAYNRIQARPIIAHLIETQGDFVDILDIAGADGYIPNIILKSKPNTNVTIIDLPDALEKCGSVFNEHITSNRMHLVNCDAREFDMQRTYDLVMVTEVTELFNLEDKQTVVEKAFSHTKMGGTMVITKFAFTEDDLAIEALTFFSLKMFAKLKEAYLETDKEIEDILERQGIGYEKKRFGDKSVYICHK